MRVAGIQSDVVWEDPEANRAALLPRIEAAVREGARLVALVEMWPTGFSMDVAKTVEPEDGPSETFLRATADRLGVVLAGSLARTRPDWPRPRNVLVVARPGLPLLRYAKIHTFTFGGESEHYGAGDGALTVEIDGIRVSPLICFDLRFPELFAALASRTDLFLVVANWPSVRSRHWRDLLTARAVETQAFVLGVNRVGRGGGLDYRGDSRLLSPLGEILSEAPTGADGLVLGEVTAEAVADLRSRSRFLEDRRPDVYRAVRDAPTD